MMERKQLEGLRVAVLAADGFEQVELTEPVETLREQGADVEIVSLRPWAIQGMNLLAPGKKVGVDRTLFTARARKYDALLLPGGFTNPDFLRQSDRALEFVREFDRAGKPIAVICHGPWVLISAGLVRGRRLASWPGIQDDVRNAGGLWENSAVVHDDNWISSRGPRDLAKFKEAMVTRFAEYLPRALEEREQERGGVPVTGLVAGGLALAAVGYGIQRTRSRGGQSEAREESRQE